MSTSEYVNGFGKLRDNFPVAYRCVTTAPMTLIDKTARTTKQKACCNDLGTLFAESNNLPMIEVKFLTIRMFRKYFK